MANTQNINIGDSWKDMVSGQINIGDAWKDIAEIQVNIGDSWKTAYVSVSPWDVSTASYDSKYKYIGSEDDFPYGIFFKPDGTKMYITGNYNDNVFQYTLSTAWDVSTASYDSKYKYIGSEDDFPYGIFFKPDGTKMYITGNYNDNVFQYTLSTAWDVSTASYDSKYKYIGSVDMSQYGLFFKPDGTKMYTMGNQNDTVYQYTLSTAWDVSTISYASKSVNVNDEDIFPFGVFFKPDGTKMYITGGQHETVYQYTLSTAWDVSTASYDSKSKDVSDEDDTLYGVFFKPDGTKMYVTGSINDTVYQYTLSTAWDVSTASYDSKSKDVSDEDDKPYRVFFKPDGTKMYILGGTNKKVYQYSIG